MVDNEPPLATYHTVKDAIEKGDIAKILDFVKQGFNFNLIDIPYNHTPLIAYAKIALMIDVVVRGGADINGTDDEGHTALFLAMGSDTDSTEVVLELIRLGADTTRTYNNSNHTVVKFMRTRIEDANDHIDAAVDSSDETLNRLTTRVQNWQLNVNAYEEGVRMVWMRTTQLSFAMGHHPRLGVGSAVLHIEPEIVRMILANVF